MNTDLVEEAKKMQRQSERAIELMEADRRLPYLSAFVMAGDILWAENIREAVEAGELPVMHSFQRVGSYARLDMVEWAEGRKFITRAQARALIVQWWSGSDPDDTKPYFHGLWYDAWLAHGRRIIEDSPGMWDEVERNDDGTVTVYRGQDEDAPYGIAWTTDIVIARKFAAGSATRQSNRAGKVHRAYADPAKVWAYLTDRDESEVVLDPFSLTGEGRAP